MNIESRQWSRYRTLSLATLQLYGPGDGVDTRLSGCVMDVSLGGAGLRCASPLAVGMNMWVRIDLEGEALVALAEVVNADPSSLWSGLLFTRMCRDSFSVLHRFVGHQQPGQPQPLPCAQPLPLPWAPAQVAEQTGGKRPARVRENLLSGRSA